MPNSTNVVKQWVSEVVSYSSQYNNTTWAANSVIGQPRAYPGYGDLHHTWAQSSHSANEYIELKFPQELIVTGLHIYETFHAGAIVCIKLWNKDKWELVYGPTQAQDINQSRIFSPDLRKTNFKTNLVRLELDCTVSGTWCEIDCVEMEGKIPISSLQTEEDLSNDFKKLFYEKEFCDIEFEVEGKIVQAHRNILAARSTFFKNMLCENLKSNRLTKPIHIEHISYNAFKCLLFYLYTNRIEENTKSEIICEIMRQSEKYNISDIKDVCFEYINSSLDQNNVINIYINSMFIQPILPEVANMCLKFISRHFSLIVERKEFKDLPQDILISITQYYAQNRRN